MHRELIGQVQTALRRLDGINVATMSAIVTSGVAASPRSALAREPPDRHPVALRGRLVPARGHSGASGSSWNLGSRAHRDPLVEQIDQAGRMRSLPDREA